MRRRVAGADECEHGPALRAYRALGASLGLRRLPPLRVSAQIDSPQLVGPPATVLLPQRQLAELSDDELAMALHHELAHLRRRDLWWVASAGAPPVLLPPARPRDRARIRDRPRAGLRRGRARQPPLRRPRLRPAVAAPGRGAASGDRRGRRVAHLHRAQAETDHAAKQDLLRARRPSADWPRAWAAPR
nr:M56 family metallopeptidase [Lysobacter enzymogenes]